MNSELPRISLESGFARKVLNSAGWSTLAGYLQLIVSFSGNLILARILIPDDFGVFALAGSLLVFLFMVAGFGSQEAIVQCREESITKLIPTAFWISVGIAGTLSILGILLAIILRPFYSDIVVQLICALALLRFFENIANVFSAVLQRDLRFKPIAFTTIVSTPISFLLAGMAAWLGAGPWALFLREAIASFIKIFSLWRASRYRIVFQFDQHAARWIWSFGWRMMITRISEVIFGRFDNLVVGTILGTTSLGYYSFSYRLAFLAQQLTQGAIQPVVFATFSSLQHSTQKLKYGFERLNYWLWRAVLPLGLIVALFGDVLVVLLYGEKWQPAGHIFQLMSIFLLVMPLHESTRHFLIGAGYLNVVMRIRLIQIAFFIPAVLLAALAGNLSTVVWIVNTAMVLSWWLMLRAVNKITTVNWMYLLKPPLAAITISIGSNWFLALFLRTATDSFILSFLRIGFILVSYFVSLLLVERESLFREFDSIRTQLAH